MSDITADWPVTVDDDGTGTTGTPLDSALWALMKTAINNQVYSLNNPALKAKDIIDEVKTARGSTGALNTRLSVGMGADGTLILPASVTSLPTDLKSSSGFRNVAPDSLFALWPDGDALAPYGWTLTGTGAAIARTGDGGGGYESAAPGDATKMKFGKFAAKITRGSADAKLTRTVIPAAYFPSGWKGKKVSFLIRCKSATPNQASIIIDDGIGTQRGGQAGNGTFHTGGGAEEILYGTITLNANASKLDVILEVAGSGNAYFSNLVVCRSDVVPDDWLPERWGYYIVPNQQAGNATVANQVNELRHDFELPALLVNTRLRVKTAPTTTAIIVRPAKGTGTYPYGTNPSIAALGLAGTKRPEGAYANRCFKPGDFLTWDVTQIGTGTVGAEINAAFVFVVCLAELDILNE